VLSSRLMLARLRGSAPGKCGTTVDPYSGL
jgi:hypothetical protein